MADKQLKNNGVPCCSFAIRLILTRKPCCHRKTMWYRCKFSSIWRVQAAKNVGENCHLRFNKTGNSATRSADPEP